MVTTAERIRQLQARKERVAARANAEITRLRVKERRKARTDNTRRKVLVGALMLSSISAPTRARKIWTQSGLLACLHEYLQRDADRVLFGLPALQAHQEQDAAAADAAGEEPKKRAASNSDGLKRRRARERRNTRNEDIRRKVLVGALMLSLVERGLWKHENLLAHLDGFLEKAVDRALFDLPPRAPAGETGHDQAPADTADAQQ